MSDVQTEPRQQVVTSASREIAVVRGQLDAMQDQFKVALPAHIPAERFNRVAMTAIQNNPDLLKCDRRSLFNSFMRAAQDGLLPDGREGAVVAYGKIAQWLPMVAGILKKIRNSGEVSTIVARVVYGGDKYRNWIDDEGEHIEYEAAEAQDRNVIRRVFAMAKLKDGSIEVEPMSAADVEKVRAVSRAKNNGPWVSWWEEMAKKTAIRRLSKRLPISSDLDDLIRRDDGIYDIDKASDKATVAPPADNSLGARLGAMAADPEPDAPADPETGEIIEHDSPAPSEAPESAGGVPPGTAEATPQGPLEGAAASPSGAAAPSDAEADINARRAEIRKDGDARAAAGTAALRNFLDELRENGESDLFGATLKASWHDTAKAADAKGRKA